jgi:hypothetical protein
MKIHDKFDMYKLEAILHSFNLGPEELTPDFSGYELRLAGQSAEFILKNGVSVHLPPF